MDILRGDGKTEVVVVQTGGQQGQQQVLHQLDEALIEFGTALEDGDLNRAIAYLESLGSPLDAPEAEAMWRRLAHLALDGRQLHVAERCFAALGDVSKAKFLRETLNVADAAADAMGGNSYDGNH